MQFGRDADLPQINPCPAGVSAERAPLGGGGGQILPSPA